MSYASKVTQKPTHEPVSLAEAKLHLRVDHNDEDTLIGALITQARLYVENSTRRTLMTQTLETKLPCFADRIYLKHPPLQSITSIRYIDTDGVEQTLDSAVYDVDTHSDDGLVVLAYNQVWPAVRAQHHPITITSVHGYGDEADDVPEALAQAILLLVGVWYEQREAVSFGSNAIPNKVPFGLESLISQYRVFGEV